MTGDPQKKVDESWKDTVEKEKTVPLSRAVGPEDPALGFLEFISTLAMQALMALGQMPHPETRQTHEDLPQAKYLIDTIQLLNDKTKGNLSVDETATLKNILYELKTKFVKKSEAIA